MPDYKSMYEILFRAMTKAIGILQEAQCQTEEMYITSGEPIVEVLKNTGEGGKDGTIN